MLYYNQRKGTKPKERGNDYDIQRKTRKTP